MTRRLARPVLDALALVAVCIGASGFAWAFRESVARALQGAGGSTHSVDVASRHADVAIALVVTAAVLVSSRVARWARNNLVGPTGLHAVTDAVENDGPTPRLLATLGRATANWLAMFGLSSLGREAPLLEAGGALGGTIGARLRSTGRSGSLRPADLAVAGVAAAFATAYHAPIAAFLYVHEHVSMRTGRRGSFTTAFGAASGFWFSVVVLGGGAVFPRGHHPFDPGTIIRAALVSLPALAAVSAFLALRRVLAAWLAGLVGSRAELALVMLAIVAGVAVALVPIISGNGMEAIRHVATDGSSRLALELLLVKLVATAAVLEAGAPGGIFSPAMAITAGAGTLTMTAALHWWPALGGTHWDGALAAMAVGAMGATGAPLTAIVVIGELAGDYRLIPACLVSVGLAQGVSRLLPLVRRSWATRPGAAVDLLAIEQRDDAGA